MRGEERLQLCICYFSGLGEPVHATTDFHINMTIVHQIVELIMLHDALREGGKGDLHVCIILRRHWGTQVEVLEVAHHASSIWSGQDAVEKEFGGDDVGSFGADVAVILNSVAADVQRTRCGTVFQGGVHT